MHRTRKIAAAAALTAGVLTGSLAPAQAIPSEPDAEDCQRVDQYERIAARQIDRIEARIERMTARAEERPDHADRLQRRIDRAGDRIDRIAARLEALVAFCAPRPAPDIVDDAAV